MYSSRERMGRQYTRPSLVPSIDLQELGADIRIYGEIDDISMRHFNPSIAFHDGKLKIAIRSCNFAVNRHGNWYFRDNSAYSKTDVLYGNLDPDTLQINDIHKLTLPKDSPIITLLAGLEDVRLFSRKDGMHLIGFESDRITRHLHNASTAMAEYMIRDNKLIYLRTLKKPDPEVVEKNWSPTDHETNEFEFTYSPTQVWKDGKLIGIPYKGQIHGGTQLIKQTGGTYLSLVHDKILDPMLNRPGVYDKFIYRTYLARHDKAGIITDITKPFTFGTHENIEFASGMVEHDGNFIISIGIRDCKFGIVKINKNKLVELLEPIIS